MTTSEKLPEHQTQLNEQQLDTVLHAMHAASASRVPLEITLAALADDNSDRRLAAAARQLSQMLTTGATIDDAVAKLDRQLPEEVRGLVDAGLESGDLAGTFERFAEQRMATQRTARRLRTAIAYPLVILGVLIPLLLFFDILLIPMFEEIFEDFDLEVPPLTRAVIDTSHQLASLVGALAAVIVAIPFLLRLVGGRWLMHRVRSATPLIGPLWMWSGQREFAAMLASFLKLRLPMLSAIRHSRAVLHDRNIAQACRRISERLETGQPLSACLSHSMHFDRSLVSLVKWGEVHNVLPESLVIAAAVFDDRIEQQVVFVRRLLPPVTMIVVGTVAFLVAVGLMLPLVGLIDGLSM